MFSQPPGPMSESCVMRLTMDSKSMGNPTRAGAATILFSTFVTPRDFPTRSDHCKPNVQRSPGPKSGAHCVGEPFQIQSVLLIRSDSVWAEIELDFFDCSP